jgi:hypothetical protein
MLRLPVALLSAAALLLAGPATVTAQPEAAERAVETRIVKPGQVGQALVGMTIAEGRYVPVGRMALGPTRKRPARSTTSRQGPGPRHRLPRRQHLERHGYRSAVARVEQRPLQLHLMVRAGRRTPGAEVPADQWCHSVEAKIPASLHLDGAALALVYAGQDVDQAPHVTIVNH